MRRVLLGLVLAGMMIGAMPRLAHADDMDDAMVLLEKFADTILADKGNCDKMATDINAFIDANKDKLAAVAKKAKEATPEQQKQWKEKYGARQQAMGKKMVEGMGDCAKEKKVKDALDRFPK